MNFVETTVGGTTFSPAVIIPANDTLRFTGAGGSYCTATQLVDFREVTVLGAGGYVRLGLTDTPSSFGTSWAYTSCKF